MIRHITTMALLLADGDAAYAQESSLDPLVGSLSSLYRLSDASLVLFAKAVMFREMGLEVNICGQLTESQ